MALYARNNRGVNFVTVEAFDEPSSAWWTATGAQEGCHCRVRAVGPTARGRAVRTLQADGVVG
ncbi:hypothetical protein [Streptomyces sp. NPDC003480]